MKLNKGQMGNLSKIKVYYSQRHGLFPRASVAPSLPSGVSLALKEMQVASSTRTFCEE
jgi:hypothetical protein